MEKHSINIDAAKVTWLMLQVPISQGITNRVVLSRPRLEPLTPVFRLQQQHWYVQVPPIPERAEVVEQLFVESVAAEGPSIPPMIINVPLVAGNPASRFTPL